LGIYIDSSLSWKNNITDLSSWLNKASYAIRAIKLLMSPNSMRIKRIIRVITSSGKLD
jgi:hypothetical protein